MQLLATGTLIFPARTSPDKFELSGKTEVLVFALTFLTSTWYIMNPFLKSKINDVCMNVASLLSISSLSHWDDLGLVLRHLAIPLWKSGCSWAFTEFPPDGTEALDICVNALLHWYVSLLVRKCVANTLVLEVEQTGASSQFYDKFSMWLLYLRYATLTDAHSDARWDSSSLGIHK